MVGKQALDLVVAVPLTENMTPFFRLSLVGLWLALSGASVRAQEKEPEKKSGIKEVEVKVVRISETRRYSADRDAYSGNITVELDINSGIETAQLLDVEIASAKDDKGTDLLDPKKITFEARAGSFTKKEKAPTANLRLEVPAREAQEISEIKGTATFQDNSLAEKPVDLTDFSKSPGEYLKDERLEKFGISVAYLDEETFDAKGADLIWEIMGVEVGEQPLLP